MLQRLVFLAAFVVYLETETLVTREAVAEILGSKFVVTEERKPVKFSGVVAWNWKTECKQK